MRHKLQVLSVVSNLVSAKYTYVDVRISWV